MQWTRTVFDARAIRSGAVPKGHLALRSGPFLFARADGNIARGRPKA